jgi:hypothetical protein
VQFMILSFECLQQFTKLPHSPCCPKQVIEWVAKNLFSLEQYDHGIMHAMDFWFWSVEEGFFFEFVCD